MRTRARALCFVCVVTLFQVALAAPGLGAERIAHGRFADVEITRPAQAARAVALLLGPSADGASASVASALAARGTLVVVVDVPALFARLEQDGAPCVLADGDLENLSHFVQGYAGLPTYYRPWLIGLGPGAPLVYAMLAQAPVGIFAGGISVGFSPQLALRKPLCAGSALRSTQGASGSELLPALRLAAPWVALECGGASGCDEPARAFVEGVPGAARVVLPGVAPGYADARAFLPSLLAAYEQLVAVVPTAEPPPPLSLADLPLIEKPADGSGTEFAVILTGDGGWAGLDKALAQRLVARGISVVGLDSLRYFWRARTPAQLGADLDRVLRFYAARWQRQRAVVIGYSQGADVLPFALNRLSPAADRLVSLAVLLGPEQTASFEFHLGNWIGADPRGLPNLPEALRLSAQRTLCIYGRDDETICPRLAPLHARVFQLPGGHHFNGDYGQLADLILDQAQIPPPAAATSVAPPPVTPSARAAPPQPPPDSRR